MIGSRLYDAYLHQEAEWANITAKMIGADSRLLNVSSDSVDSRVYRLKNRVVKIRKIGEPCFSESKLYKEYEIQNLLDTVLKEKLFNPSYETKDGYELLGVNYLGGSLVERLLEEKNISFGDLFRIFRAVLKINLHGVCHRDLRSNNITIDQTGRILIFDFDQALTMSPLTAIINDIFGIGIGVPRAIHPYRRLVQRVLTYKFPVLAKILTKMRNSETPTIAPYIPSISDQSIENSYLLKLEDAWEIAAGSNANSPGGRNAYYSLCIAGAVFRGERSWESRWTAINKAVDFRGKNILELGCNMGLFSVFAVLAGARRSVGIDIDPDIIKSARLIAEAFEVENEYRVQDFDDENAWEENYADFDVVLALSVLNWVKDKQRLMNFLEKHQSIIYEGHDPFEMEYDRLITAGFISVQVISISERGRAIFYAKKA